MKALRLFFVSMLIVGSVAAVFSLLVWFMSDEQRVRQAHEYSPVIALAIMFIWLIFGWAVTDLFGRAMAVAVLEGVFAYGTFRVTSWFLIDSYEWAEWWTSRGEPRVVDPKTDAVFFLVFVVFAIFSGVLLLAAPDVDESDDTPDEGSSGGSRSSSSAATTILTTVAISSMMH